MHSKQAAVGSRLAGSQSRLDERQFWYLSQPSSLFKVCICQLSHLWSMFLCYLTVLLVMRYCITRSLCSVRLIRLNVNTDIYLNYLTYKSALEHKVLRDKETWQVTKWYLSFGVFFLKCLNLGTCQCLIENSCMISR